jgi:hypothetical protein
MKKQILKIASVVFFSVFFIACNHDNELTEEDILKYDQQDVPYSLRVSDPFLKNGVKDVKITVTIDGQVKEFMTDVNGVVQFSTRQKDILIVDMVKDGYFSRQTKINMISLSKSRESDLFYNIPIYPTAAYGTFTVTGNMQVQSDLTTHEAEPASGASFEVTYTAYNGSVDENEIIARVQATTDENGRYEVALPAISYYDNGYAFFAFNYFSYGVKQTLAINNFLGEELFPKTLPSIQQIDTQFDPTSGALATIPLVTRDVFVTIPSPPNGVNALQASPFLPQLDGISGILTGPLSVPLGVGGGGYGSSDIPLTVKSLKGGTGAVGVIRDTNSDGVLDQYEFTSSGAGYPLGHANVNKVVTQYFWVSTFLQNSAYNNYDYPYTAGQIVTNNVNYGTGVQRTVEVQ